MAENAIQGNRITEGPIWRQLLYFFFPILLGTFFQQLYNTADAMIVGNFVGKEALAAVGGTTSVLINFLVNLFVGLSSGATVIIAQFYGAGKLRELRDTVHTAVALSLAAGVGITVLGIAFSRPALQAMGVPADIMDMALTYMRIYFAGTVASFLYNVGSGILRAVGDTRRPLYFLIVACLTNIVLDLFFVVVLHWGVAGVALATILSQCVSAVLVLLVLTRRNTVYQLSFRELRFHGAILGDILRIGLPAGIQSDMYCISNILIQSCINSFGVNTMAAWTAFGKMDGFYWMISGAFGVAITTFVGQNFGARKYDRVRRSVKVCLGMILLATLVLSALFLLFGQPILRLFTDDGEVLALGVKVIWLMCPYYVTFILIEVLSGAVRGTGDSLVPMLLTCGGVCVLRILWILFLLPIYPYFETVVVSYPITWVITSVLFVVYYLQGGWLRRRIRRAGFEPEPQPAHAGK